MNVTMDMRLMIVRSAGTASCAGRAQMGGVSERRARAPRKKAAGPSLVSGHGAGGARVARRIIGQSEELVEMPQLVPKGCARGDDLRPRARERSGVSRIVCVIRRAAGAGAVRRCCWAAMLSVLRTSRACTAPCVYRSKRPVMIITSSSVIACLTRELATAVRCGFVGVG